MKKYTVIAYFILINTLMLVLSSCANQHSSGFNPFSKPTQLTSPAHYSSSWLDNPGQWEGGTNEIWAKLQQIPLPKLSAAASKATEEVSKGWLELAVISKRYSTNTSQLIHELLAWRTRYPNHPGNQLFPNEITLSKLLNTSPPRHLVVLLPLQGQFASLGDAVRSGVLNAYYAAQGKLGGSQAISFIDTTKNPDIAASYQQALSQGADVVIGPLTKADVQQLSRGSFPVPTIALNYTEAGFGSLPTNFYEFGLSPIDEANQIADKAADSKLSRAIVIAPQSEWGHNIVNKLTERWKANGGSITDVLYFTPGPNLSQDIARLLHANPNLDPSKDNNAANAATQRRQDFDVVFLLAPPQSARQIVPYLRFYYVNDVPIYATSTIYSGIPLPQKDTDLNGVKFPETPWILKMGKTGTTSTTDVRFNRLYAVGRDAYLISHELPRFTLLANFPLYASTGALVLTPKQQFYRRLPWTEMNEGHP
jgi:outer membrane PBP1 activator LpoA protein